VRDRRVWVALVAQFGSKLASHTGGRPGVVLVARRQTLCAYNRQVRQLPEELQHRECGLIEIGRQHARDFDAGHFASGTACHRVLTELRKLAKHMASPAATTATPVRSVLDDIRARCADRITCSAVVVGMCDSVV
jgi:hypothetical protein